MIALLIVFGLACAKDLTPAPTALEVPGRGVGAIASDADVRLEARVQAWMWVPARLDRFVTPVLVRIENHGSHPTRVRYDDFVIEDATGKRYTALPPFDIDESVSVPIRDYGYARNGFQVAPHLHGHFPSHGVYRGFAYDRVYYDDNRPVFTRVDMPTGDMLTHALPEGVIDSEGRAEGFLYFEEVEDTEQGPVVLRFVLTDAKTQTRFGEIEIPFVFR